VIVSGYSDVLFVPHQGHFFANAKKIRIIALNAQLFTNAFDGIAHFRLLWVECRNKTSHA
jgi:hypothetical protein